MAQGQDGPKLKTPAENTYRYVTLAAAYYAASRKGYAGDVKLVGDFETEGRAHWHAPWKVAEAMCAAGVLQQNGDKFAIIPGQRISFIYAKVALENGRRYDWTVTARDTAGAAMTLNPYPAPIEPGTQATPADPTQTQPQTPPQAGPAPGHQLDAGAVPPPPDDSTQQDRGEAKAKHDRQTLGQVDALYGLSLVVAAYQQVRFFNVPAVDLNPGALQAGAATILIQLERAGYGTGTDRRPSYLKRLRKLEHSLWPDHCPDPDADAKPKAGNGAKAEPEPPPVSRIPGAQPAAIAADGQELDDDLPF